MRGRSRGIASAAYWDIRQNEALCRNLGDFGTALGVSCVALGRGGYRGALVVPQGAFSNQLGHIHFPWLLGALFARLLCLDRLDLDRRNGEIYSSPMDLLESFGIGPHWMAGSALLALFRLPRSGSKCALVERLYGIVAYHKFWVGRDSKRCDVFGTEYA